jgi:hypothetical protein
MDIFMTIALACFDVQTTGKQCYGSLSLTPSLWLPVAHRVAAAMT